MNPFISIVVTTHHRHELLEKALDSIYKQDFDDFEIVLCTDEGSKETKSIAFNKLRTNDIFISIPGLKGPAELRNMGVQVARGKWICFLDDDDSFSIDYLKNAATYLNNENTLYYFNYFITECNSHQNKAEIKKITKFINSALTSEYLYISNYIPIGSFIISKNTAKKHEFDKYLSTHEDWDWLLAIKKSEEIEFKYIELDSVNIYNYPDISRNNPNDRNEELRLDYLYIYRKWRSNANTVQLQRKEILDNWKLEIDEKYL